MGAMVALSLTKQCQRLVNWWDDAATARATCNAWRERRRALARMFSWER